MVVCYVKNESSVVPVDSPFRYPGGKSWLVRDIVSEITRLKRPPRLFLEPFAGGASVALAVGAYGLSDKILLVEKDPNVAAVWRTILGPNSEWLARRIIEFDINRDSVEQMLASKPHSIRHLAFLTLLRNRVTHGGVLSATGGLLKNGERGNGVSSRWYPVTLATRIRKIALLRDRMSFIEGDGMEYLRKHSQSKTTCMFVDPPYTERGKQAGLRLYNESEVDHEEIFRVCQRGRATAFLTYDDNALIRKLARRYGFGFRKVQMRSTHHKVHDELFLVAHGGRT